MKIFKNAINIALIKANLPGNYKLVNENIEFNNVAELNEANENSICFFQNKKLIEELKATKAGLIFVPIDFDESILPETNLFFSPMPYAHFMMLVKKWLELEAKQPKQSISPSSVISSTAVLGNNVVVKANAVIGENVKIDDNTIIGENCTILDDVTIGKNCLFYPNVTVYQDCEIKNNVILHAGCVIGADGFGYIPFEGVQHKVPQVGNVILEDYVEIGANSCVDRATLSSTIIGKGTKIDNLVQVGHNCKINQHSVVCAQVGLAGSTNVGSEVYLAGQVGVAGHLTIADKTVVGAQSGIASSTTEKSKMFGSPAMEASAFKRLMFSQRTLSENYRKILQLVKKEEENKKG